MSLQRILWPKKWLSYSKTYVKSLEVSIWKYKLFSAPRYDTSNQITDQVENIWHCKVGYGLRRIYPTLQIMLWPQEVSIWQYKH